LVAWPNEQPVSGSSRLSALNSQGRLTTIIGTSSVVSATKTDDGGTVEQVERDLVMFMKDCRWCC